MSYPNNTATGQIWLQGLISAGPSIGLIRRPIFNEREITDGGTTNVDPYDFLILLNAAAAQTVQFPDVVQWMRQPWGQFPILVKDKGNNAGTYVKTVLPFGSQTIDGLASFSIQSDGGFGLFRPYSDLTGWMTAA